MRITDTGNDVGLQKCKGVRAFVCCWAHFRGITAASPAVLPRAFQFLFWMLRSVGLLLEAAPLSVAEERKINL